MRTGFEPSGENPILAVSGGAEEVDVGGGCTDDAVEGVRNDASGIRFTSSAVVLIRVGAPIWSSLTFLPLLPEVDRFDASFSFIPLRSEKLGPEPS